MAATFADSADLAEHPRFIRVVRAAIIKSSTAVGTEPADQSQRGLARRALSVNILQDADRDRWARRFAWAVALNPVITLDSSESDVEFTVASVWDAVAGAEPAAA